MRFKHITSSLVEGVQYGEKEKQYVISNLDKFNFGIEIELRLSGIDKGITIAKKDFKKLITHAIPSDYLEYDEIRSGSDLKSRIQDGVDDRKSIIDKLTELYNEEELYDYVHTIDIINFLRMTLGRTAGNYLKKDIELEDGKPFVKFLEMFNIDHVVYQEKENSLSSLSEVESVVKDRGYGDVFEVKWEHNDMAELISNTVSGENILDLMDASKKICDILVNEHGMTAEEFSGLHLSISYNSKNLDMDFIKFFMLSDTYRQVIPKEHRREYVNDVRLTLLDACMAYLYDYGHRPFEINYFLKEILWAGAVDFEKNRSVNMGSFDTQHGRVELRWPGGKNYTERMDQYFDSAFRAMYALEAAYNPDAFRKEYLKTVVKEVNNVFNEHYKMDFISIVETVRKCLAYAKSNNVSKIEFEGLGEGTISMQIDGTMIRESREDIFNEIKRIVDSKEQ